MNKTVKAERKIAMIPVCLISGSLSMRRGYSRAELAALSRSIERNGILQPLIVRFVTNYDFELISGERRLRAAVMVGYTSVPCIILHCSKRQSAVYSLVENVQRESPGNFEKAESLRTLIDDFGFSEEQAASQLGITQRSVREYLSILEFSEAERRLIRRSNMSVEKLNDILKTVAPADRRKELSKSAETDLHKYVIKDVRIFYNTIERAVSAMKKTGINARVTKSETKDCVEYNIRIPLSH